MANLKDLVVDGVLHQDKYTGTVYRYETSSLTIVGHNGETGANRKRYIVRCSVCSDDKDYMVRVTSYHLKGIWIEVQNPVVALLNVIGQKISTR